MKSNWWRGGTIYQIYPRSYQDSTGDGCGDIKGISSRLQYISNLGVDAIWISPFFLSPMKDYGYDVADYRQIDPLFGSLDDFDQLLAQAHSYKLKVMIDLVISHTSDQHNWFVESRQNHTNSKADWYVWANPKADGSPPNNWLSVFGGSAWQWDTRRCQYYLHNFLVSQPDLNFHNAEVQDEVLTVADFWLKRGVDGFRLDTINFYFHDDQLRDNPALPVDQRGKQSTPSINPHSYQEHVYDRNRPENKQFLERLRQLLDQYQERSCVGELADAGSGHHLLADYTKDNKRAHLCYTFDLLAIEHLSALKIKTLISQIQNGGINLFAVCWALSNHDVMRHASRLTNTDADIKTKKAHTALLASLLLSLPGTVCIYQGEELGLGEAEVAFDDLHDPYGIEFWPEYKGRDGCRTPMVWEKESKNGGFSTADKCWLPVYESHLELAVDQQIEEADGMLAHYQRHISLRNKYKSLYEGGLEFVDFGVANVLAYRRTYGEQSILCIFNMLNQPQEITLPSNRFAVINSITATETINGGRYMLTEYAAIWLQEEE